MRKAIAILAGLAVLAFGNVGIWQREQLLTEGRLVLLELAPVDPRSLMQGDYMRLNFALANEALPMGLETGEGRLIVMLDRNHVAQLRRRDDGSPLAPGEVAIKYRIRGGSPNFGTNAYFFEEGSAAIYADAAYGEFRVDADGEMILTGLRDRGGRRLGPER